MVSVRNMLPMPSAGKHVADAERGKIRNRCWARENMTGNMIMVRGKRKWKANLIIWLNQWRMILVVVIWFFFIHLHTYFISNESPNVQRADGGKDDDDDVNRSWRSWNKKEEELILYKTNIETKQLHIPVFSRHSSWQNAEKWFGWKFRHDIPCVWISINNH